MANIKATIALMKAEDLKPVNPGPPTPNEALEPTEEQIQDVVEKLVTPWVHGDNLARFARQSGLTVRQVREIKVELDAHIKTLDKDAEVEVEPEFELE